MDEYEQCWNTGKYTPECDCDTCPYRDECGR